MDTGSTKACVFGAGAIGGHLLARLDAGGAVASAVLRGANLRAVRENGLTVEAPDGTFHCRPACSDDPAELGVQDVVFVCVKAPALPSVAAAIAPLLGPDTVVVFVMNGIPWWWEYRGQAAAASVALLDPGGVLGRAVGFPRAVGATIYSSCTVVAPGHVLVESRNGRIVVGEPAGPVTARLEALAVPLRAGGMGVELTDRIRDAVWAKLLINLGLGMMGVLSAAPPRDYLREPACQATVRTVIAEASALAAALGCTVNPDVEAQIRHGLASGHKTSILQDLELGRPMEIDALYTVPLAMAREAGVATPTLDLLAGLVRSRARMAGLYPA